jgi:hypothetical protein
VHHAVDACQGGPAFSDEVLISAKIKESGLLIFWRRIVPCAARRAVKKVLFRSQEKATSVS